MNKSGNTGHLHQTDIEILNRTLGRAASEAEKIVIGEIWGSYKRDFPYQDMIRRSHSSSDEVPIYEEQHTESEQHLFSLVRGNITKSKVGEAILAGLQQMISRRVYPSVVAVNRNVPDVAGSAEKSNIAKPRFLAGIPALHWSELMPVMAADIKRETANLIIAGQPATVDINADYTGTGKLIALQEPATSSVKASEKILTFLVDLIARPWIYGIIENTDKKAITAITSYLGESKTGLRVRLPQNAEAHHYYLGQFDQMLGFIHLQAGFEQELQTGASAAGISTREVGNITRQPILEIGTKLNKQVEMPIAIFTPDSQILTTYDLHPPGQRPQATSADTTLKTAGVQDFNKIIKRLLPAVVMDISKNYQGETPADADGSIHVSLSRNQWLGRSNPQLAAMMAVAEGARWVACRGGKPQAVAGHLPVSAVHQSKRLGIFQQVARGIAEAGRNLGLSTHDLTIDYTAGDGITQPVVGVTGFCKNRGNDLPARRFRSAEQFITILGSLRGELGNSLYRQQIYDDDAGTLPAIDFGMERRLGEVLTQGTQERLVQSACAIGRGGLAMALADCLIRSEAGIGARIHLSRKLLPEELLFGETQGTVMIALEENDLMEFERICMNVGIPSTTIGRVTDDDHFRFNDLIDIAVNDLRKVLGNQ